MQSPTPPTRPTPPTPPSMKSPIGTSSNDTHSLTTTTPQSVNPSKAIPTSKEQPTTIPAPVSQSTNNLPPLASFSTANHSANEITSERSIPATTDLSKNNPPATVYSVFYILIFIIAITLVAVHRWKNYKPKQGSTVDYSTESSDDIVNLILSQNNIESVVPPTPKKVGQKNLQQGESAPKTKGNFEVRI